jgi:hypothetical protein
MLNTPQPVAVTPDAQGQPRAVLLDGRWNTIDGIVDVWLVEEEWWRTPIRRRYIQALLDDGRSLTLFEDLEDTGDARWYRQQAMGSGQWAMGNCDRDTSALVSRTP